MPHPLNSVIITSLFILVAYDSIRRKTGLVRQAAFTKPRKGLAQYRSLLDKKLRSDRE
jgi:hypothetical protein